MLFVSSLRAPLTVNKVTAKSSSVYCSLFCIVSCAIKQWTLHFQLWVLISNSVCHITPFQTARVHEGKVKESPAFFMAFPIWIFFFFKAASLHLNKADSFWKALEWSNFNLPSTTFLKLNCFNVNREKIPAWSKLHTRPFILYLHLFNMLSY